MAGILRGDIHWADLNPIIGSEQGGFRPVLILSHNIFNERSGTVIEVAITSQSQRGGYPLALELSGIKLPKESWPKSVRFLRYLQKESEKRSQVLPQRNSLA